MGNSVGGHSYQMGHCEGASRSIRLTLDWLNTYLENGELPEHRAHSELRRELYDTLQACFDRARRQGVEQALQSFAKSFKRTRSELQR